jgi:hypothetical protein
MDDRIRQTDRIDAAGRLMVVDTDWDSLCTESRFVAGTVSSSKTNIHGIVEIDDTGFYFKGEKVEDAGKARRAFLEALNSGGSPEQTQRLREMEREYFQMKEALSNLLAVAEQMQTQINQEWAISEEEKEFEEPEITKAREILYGRDA